MTESAREGGMETEGGREGGREREGRVLVLYSQFGTKQARAQILSLAWPPRGNTEAICAKNCEPIFI